jgi:hypothetical protein
MARAQNISICVTVFGLALVFAGIASYLALKDVIDKAIHKALAVDSPLHPGYKAYIGTPFFFSI